MTGADSQAIAHTIVFSFIQRKRHPKIFLIPNILISPNSIRIIMYDAVNNILICSLPLSIFQSYLSKSLEIAFIIILWMVLHYRMFCDGIDASLIKKADIEIKNIQANFKERANEKLDFYVIKVPFPWSTVKFRIPPPRGPRFWVKFAKINAICKNLLYSGTSSRQTKCMIVLNREACT